MYVVLKIYVYNMLAFSLCSSDMYVVGKENIKMNPLLDRFYFWHGCGAARRQPRTTPPMWPPNAYSHWWLHGEAALSRIRTAPQPCHGFLPLG